MTDNPYPHLVDVGFARLAPAPALRPFVRWYWSMQSNGRLAHQRDEFMHADGGTGLVFNWGDKLHLPAGNYAQSVTLDTVWPQSQRLILAGRVNTFGIRFHPGGAYALFGVPMDELSETAVLADHLAPHHLTHLHDQLYDAPTLAEKAALVENWLMTRLQQALPVSRVIPSTLRQIVDTQGQLSIQNVADGLYISPRQLERLFKAQVGLSPKKIARIARINQARNLLKANLVPAHVAYSAGFYDQAHFIREFKSIVGMTPGGYLQRRKHKD